MRGRRLADGHGVGVMGWWFWVGWGGGGIGGYYYQVKYEEIYEHERDGFISLTYTSYPGS